MPPIDPQADDFTIYPHTFKHNQPGFVGVIMLTEILNLKCICEGCAFDIA